jgi:serine phosphatase RsbU (regulator of sigma subunit)/anti-sigma regulatory factor (Ser/Thr protein kinase)/anti-anti-sigma regulatory factor
MEEREHLELLAATLDQLPLPVAITRGDDALLVALNASGRAAFGERPLGESAARWLDRDLIIAPVRRDDGSVRAVVHLGHGETGPDPIDVAAELQDALLPKGLPVPQGVEVAARYLLAGGGAGAGGDWFDAIALPDGRVVAVVGDVVGQGVVASAVMGGLRALFEERVRADGDVAAALELLDRRAARLEEARASTVCTCVVDPGAGVLEYVTAGHPPPVLVTTADGPTYLPPTGAGPLGSGAPFPAARHRLAEGDLLLLYSDGLVERPGRTPAQNTVDLLGVVGDSARATSAERAVERVCRQTLEALADGGGYADDVSLLALQVVPSLPPLELELPAVPDSVLVVRTEVERWLARPRASAIDRLAVLHAVGELVENTIEHAYASVDAAHPLSVRIRLMPDGQAELTVADRGRWREPGSTHRGRGLAMARSFLDGLDVEHDEYGTRACGRHRLSRPAAVLRGPASLARGPRQARGRIAVVGDHLHLSGPVDVRSADELRSALARASLGGVRAVTVDLGGVEVLSSAAVQALYDARAAGRVVLVAPIGSPAQRVLDLVGLARGGP